jgi:alkanesulfonate monooxygenase SsuD/methylene tetrahydromethanopterin reductase-like flavin-dependent oxidoreductase (luciferase family)
MRTWYFSENAYPYLPADFESIRITLPNAAFDPVVGSRLYNRYFDEWQLADELGLDVMANEHHSTATNLNPSVSLVVAVLARITKNARILVLGNPVANRNDPVRIAEEMAMVDCYSAGRLEVGFVRGVPYEISATNARPYRTADRLWEAHDLILKAWTTHDGPFNWEGRFFHHRQVNIWPRPYQQPHPPIWITTTSTAQVAKVADLGYTAATFLTPNPHTKRVFDAYRSRRREQGLPMNEDRLGYCAMVCVGDTDEAGYAGAHKLNWINSATRTSPQFRNPPGYNATAAAATLLRTGSVTAARSTLSLEEQIAAGIVFAGNPDTVYRQIEKQYNAVGGYGHLIMLGQSGFMEHPETAASMTRFAREVYPRLRGLRLDAEAEAVVN